MRIPQYRDPLHFDVLGLGAGGGGGGGASCLACELILIRHGFLPKALATTVTEIINNELCSTRRRN